MRKQADYNKKELIQDYSNDLLSVPKIAIKYNISVQTVYDILKRENISFKRGRDNRKNKFNYHYFDDINTPDKAYFLGWLYSDGNNYPETYTISLKLQIDDINILKTFKKYITTDSNYPIKITKRSDGKDQCYICFSNKHTSKILEEKGVVKNKTFNLFFPSLDILPENLQNHFIRGYFDGDGSIFSYQPKKGKSPDYNFIISGTENILNPILDIIVKNLGFKRTKLIKNKSIFNMCYGGNQQVKKIYKWLYKDCNNLYLDRKKVKFEELINKNK